MVTVLVVLLCMALVLLVFAMAIILCLVKKLKTAGVQAAVPAPCVPNADLDKGEVIFRFYEYVMDKFLHRTFPGLRSWIPVYEQRVGYCWEREHIIRLFFLNENLYEVKVAVRHYHITACCVVQAQEAYLYIIRRE